MKNVMKEIKETKNKGKEKAKGTLEDYKNFALKGNVLDLAIGVVIGSAFTNIVNTIVNTLITPLISILTNRVDLSTLFISLNGESYPSLAKAKEAGALTFNYGELLNAILNFFIISMVLFIIIRIINHSKIKQEKLKAKIKTTKECPYCLSVVPIAASKCAFCTSTLIETENTNTEVISKTKNKNKTKK